jgi:class 3 adenylate cyclase
MPILGKRVGTGLSKLVRSVPMRAPDLGFVLAPSRPCDGSGPVAGDNGRRWPASIRHREECGGMNGHRYTKSLRTPDESTDYDLGSLDIVELGDLTVGRIILHPGWRWSVHMRPIVGGEWCEVRHAGVVLSGRFGYSFDDGSTLEIGPDDVFDIPAGHDGYTLGGEDCVMLEWSGVRATTGFTVVPRSRMVTALLFTDVVESTALARRLGDAAWHDVLSRHYEVSRTALERFGGREVETTGDGMLADFESVASALECAAAIVHGAPALGLHVRAGVHVGEVQAVGKGVRGLAVHEAARVMAAAGPDEILASETARILAETAGMTFVDRGPHDLKGLEGARHLYAFLPRRSDG